MNDCHLNRTSTYISLCFLFSLFLQFSFLLCWTCLILPYHWHLVRCFQSLLQSLAHFQLPISPGQVPLHLPPWQFQVQQAPAGRALCDSQFSHVHGCLVKSLVCHIQDQDNHVVADSLSSLVWELRLAQLTESFFMHLDIKDWEIWEYGFLWLFFVSPGPIMPQIILKNSSGLWLGFWSCFSLPTQRLWLIKEKYTHTFLGGNSPYMTHLLLRKKKKTIIVCHFLIL